MLKFIDGYKTYLAGFLIVLLSALAAFGIPVPEYAYTVIAGLGFVGLRDAVSKVTNTLDENKPTK